MTEEHENYEDSSLKSASWFILKYSVILVGLAIVYTSFSNHSTEVAEKRAVEKRRVISRSSMEVMREDGMRVCRNRIRAISNHSVDFAFGGTSIMSSNNSYTIIKIQASSKNALGLKTPLLFHCKVTTSRNQNVEVVDLRSVVRE